MRLSSIIQTGAIGALLLGVGLVACYNPEVADGTLQCSPDKRCPRGLTCDLQVPTSFCVKKLAVGTGGTTGTGGLPGTGGIPVGGIPGTGGSPMGGAGGMCATTPPIPGCNSNFVPGGVCDEVCQVGCACGQRCSLSGQTVACQQDSGGRQPVGAVCQGGGPGDNCAPGTVCLEEPEPICGNRCFRYCSDDTDCTQGAHCTVPLVVNQGEIGVKVCDVPPDNCNPTFGEGKCARQDRPGTYGCYLMGSGFPNATVCDCAGTLQEDELCEVERECAPGLFCTVVRTGEARCRPVCPLGQPVLINKICGERGSCLPFGTSNRWGTCL